jgi:hypothetical protein
MLPKQTAPESYWRPADKGYQRIHIGLTNARVAGVVMLFRF